MSYTRVNWKDYPEESTPLNADNLNVMDKGIKDLDASLEEAKEDIEDLKSGQSNAVNLVDHGGSYGTITFGMDASGNYGYYKAGADSVTPFKNPKGTIDISSNGTVDVSGFYYANVNIGGSGADLLWTNSSPSATFKSQTLSLDLSSYSGVLIEILGTAGVTAYKAYGYVPKGTITRVSIGGCRYNASAAYIGNRFVDSVSSDGITFSIGFTTDTSSNSFSSNNDRGIPMRIWGIKNLI